MNYNLSYNLQTTISLVFTVKKLIFFEKFNKFNSFFNIFDVLM